jgi:UDP-GlcNAc:undecaprenyl-phosphate GlcNAc-1-phosphate transferase
MTLFSTFLISTIITIALIPIFVNLARKADILDIPDDRKIHRDPIPRIGGVAMAIAVFIPIVMWAPGSNFAKAFLAGSAIVVIFGLIDDAKNIGFITKFSGQIIAALIIVLYGGLKIKGLGTLIPDGFVVPDWFSIPLTVFIIVAVTNAINLSDGLDGLAGGITLLTFLCIGYLAYTNGFQTYEVMAVAMIGGIFGLLRYNTHPATVFMGDAGSQLLGFASITLSLAVTQKSNQLSPILPLLIIGLPIIDTLSVMVQRIIEGKSPFVADKNHLHHKFMALGFHHSESVILIYIMHAFMVCLAFIFRFESAWFLAILYILLAVIILIFIFFADSYGWKIRRFAVVDTIIKGRIRKLKEEHVIIKVSFKSVEIGFNFLLLFTCFLPEHINVFFSIAAIFILGIILITYFARRNWTSGIIEIALFLMIPFLIYFSEKNVNYLNNTTLIKSYTFSFGILILFVLLTLKFTRRSGFKTTPMDFLILFIALVVPNLPDEQIKSWQMGLVAAKIIALFFTYEILKGELRLNTKGLNLTTVAALLIISLRGFIG